MTDSEKGMARFEPEEGACVHDWAFDTRPGRKTLWPPGAGPQGLSTALPFVDDALAGRKPVEANDRAEGPSTCSKAR